MTTCATKTKKYTPGWITYDFGAVYNLDDDLPYQLPPYDFVLQVEESFRASGVNNFVMIGYNTEYQEAYWRLYDCSEAQMMFITLRNNRSRIVMKFK